jgi:hypothetical protein
MLRWKSFMVILLLQFFGLSVVADEMHSVALIAVGKCVHAEEMLPVPALFVAEEAGAPAERAVVFERGENGPADEFRLIGDPVQPVCHVFIGLEGDNAFAMLAHARPPDVQCLW